MATYKQYDAFTTYKDISSFNKLKTKYNNLLRDVQFMGTLALTSSSIAIGSLMWGILK